MQRRGIARAPPDLAYHDGMGRRARIILATLGATALAGALTCALWPSPYSDVQSIKETPIYQDSALLASAWALPVAATYGEQVDFQRNGSVCGPTSVVNVLRSLGQPRTIDGVLEDTGYCWTGYCLPGLTLDELAEIAGAQGVGEVTVHRDLSFDEFQAHLRASNDPELRYIINFNRGPLFAGGGGHHSPIGGYLEDQDRVFVLDVNEGYQPWIVAADRLYEAMDTVDGGSGAKRGLLRLRSGAPEAEGAERPDPR